MTAKDALLLLDSFPVDAEIYIYSPLAEELQLLTELRLDESEDSPKIIGTVEAE